MSTLVTFPREKHASGRQMKVDEVKTDLDRMIFARILLENVARWIQDPSRDKIVNMDLDMPERPLLTPDQVQEMSRNGGGTFGHSTVIEPADLDLYESYMYPPLAMPEKPEVMVSYWDMNNSVVKFLEGRVMVKALCPDGIESWLVISVPVPNFHTALEGNCWGWPKYVCDEMTVARDRSEVIYEGKVRLAMDFTPGGVEDATVQMLKERGTEGGNTVSFHIDGGGMCLIRQGRGDGTDRQKMHFAEWEAGTIRTYMRPEDRCAGLIPKDCVTPGVWQRSFGLGGAGGGVMYKVQAHP